MESHLTRILPVPDVAMARLISLARFSVPCLMMTRVALLARFFVGSPPFLDRYLNATKKVLQKHPWFDAFQSAKSLSLADSIRFSRFALAILWPSSVFST